jgi:acetone carboxylase gamma subunit
MGSSLLDGYHGFNYFVFMNWDQVVQKISPYIVKIETPVASGTGFIFHFNENRDIYAIATALHVVDYAENWKQPVKIIFNNTEETLFLKETDRLIFPDYKKDSAVLLFQKGTLQLPETLIPLFPTERPISIGIEVGWLGFPAIAPYNLCFFSGTISARQEARNAYLIDGVAINGVSGGPVVYCTDTEGVQIVGTINAYAANKQSGESLPGLSIAQDVSHFHSIVSYIKSMDDAQKKKQEMEKEKASEISTTTQGT